MKINRGYTTDTTAGDRKIVYCEGGAESIDAVFYKTILGADANKFEFKPIGSSNTLFCFAETKLIKNGFCLIDRDFRADNECLKLEDKYSIKFLSVHEIENLLLNDKYLRRLSYIRKRVSIKKEIEKVIALKRVRFLADFLHFKINTHLDRFPRISKLGNSELPQEEAQLTHLLLSKLETNYGEVQTKINEIKTTYINEWSEEFNELKQDFLPGKEIFKELKNLIFNNPPAESDIAKDIASQMEVDNFLPLSLKSIFNK